MITLQRGSFYLVSNAKTDNKKESGVSTALIGQSLHHFEIEGEFECAEIEFPLMEIEIGDVARGEFHDIPPFEGFAALVYELAINLIRGVEIHTNEI